jgi:hypothetical protein
MTTYNHARKCAQAIVKEVNKLADAEPLNPQARAATVAYSLLLISGACTEAAAQQLRSLAHTFTNTQPPPPPCSPRGTHP